MLSPVRRSLAVVLSAAAMAVLLAGPHALVAQEGAKGKAQSSKASETKAETPAPAEKTGAAKVGGGRLAPPDPTHRVPPGYARLGLTEQQKERLYKLQGEYYPKIQALQKQLDALRAERETKFEAVLTREQKQLLRQEEQQKKAAAQARKALSRAAVDEKIGKE